MSNSNPGADGLGLPEDQIAGLDGDIDIDGAHVALDVLMRHPAHRPRR